MTTGCASPRPRLVVLAASSLSPALDALVVTFRRDHPGIDVAVSYDGSQALVQALRDGARADLLLTADEAAMAAAAAAGLVRDPATFASNTLVLVTPPGNPAHVTGLDGSLAGARLVVCAGTVPCGRATSQLAARAGITLRPVSEEPKVGDVVAKVESGQADAGICYHTDAAARPALATVEMAGAGDVVNRYRVALTPAAAAGAPALRAHVLSPEGQRVLRDAGFGPP